MTVGVGTAAASLPLPPGVTPVVPIGKVLPAQPKPSPGPISVPSGAADPLASVAGAADALGQSLYSATYASSELTDGGTHIVAYLTQLDPQVEAAIRGSALAADFTFVQTPHSLQWFTSLTQQITNANAALEAAGVHLIGWGDADLVTGRMTVQVLNLTPAKATLLNALFGAANLALTNGTAADIPIPASGPPRANDTPPWNGGDFITDGGPDCTSGYGARQYMLTAGHCFPTGLTVFNGSSTQVFGRFGILGPVVNRDPPGVAPYLDAEIINTSLFGGTSDLVFAGGPSSNERDAVSGIASVPRGGQVCQSGAFEGEICGLVVQNTIPVCRNFGEGAVCQLHKAINPTGGIAAGQGDSGGPVFSFQGSLLYATGLVDAVVANRHHVLTDCPTYQGPLHNLGRLCGPILFYTSIQPILSHFGLTLNIG